MTEPMAPEDAYWAILAARDDAEGELTEAGVEKALAPLFAERDRLRDVLTVTDAMVERAVKVLWPRDWVWMQKHECRDMWFDVVRAALEAALQGGGNG